jgi:hypothetical protein
LDADRTFFPIGEASGGIIAICLRGEHAGSIWYLDTMDPRPEGSNPRVAWHDRRDFTKLAAELLGLRRCAHTAGVSRRAPAAGRRDRHLHARYPLEISPT